MKIAIFGVYFGNLPPFTQLFLASCAWNKKIDFMLLGDAWKAVQGDVPDNCRIMNIDLQEFKKRAQATTGVVPNFTSPYKLCDYKPTLGHIFEKELVGYDFWGVCDTDLIFGNIDAFLRDLEQYDVYSTRSEFLSGPLFLMRNCEKINQLYRNSKDFKEILSSDKHFSFTECAFAWVPLRAGQCILDVETETESMTEVIEKAERMGTIKAHFVSLSLEPERNFKGKVTVENGRVKKEGKEYVHYHHHNNKGRAAYTFPMWNWRLVPSTLHIHKYGVYSGIRSLHLIYRSAQVIDRWKKRMKRLFNGLGVSSKDAYGTKIT